MLAIALTRKCGARLVVACAPLGHAMRVADDPMARRTHLLAAELSQQPRPHLSGRARKGVRNEEVVNVQAELLHPCDACVCARWHHKPRKNAWSTEASRLMQGKRRTSTQPSPLQLL